MVCCHGDKKSPINCFFQLSLANRLKRHLWPICFYILGIFCFDFIIQNCIVWFLLIYNILKSRNAISSLKVGVTRPNILVLVAITETHVIIWHTPPILSLLPIRKTRSAHHDGFQFPWSKIDNTLSFQQIRGVVVCIYVGLFQYFSYFRRKVKKGHEKDQFWIPKTF